MNYPARVLHALKHTHLIQASLIQRYFLQQPSDVATSARQLDYSIGFRFSELRTEDPDTSSPAILECRCIYWTV